MAQRTVLFNSTRQFHPLNISTLLNGKEDLPLESNFSIFTSVLKIIKDSARFAREIRIKITRLNVSWHFIKFLFSGEKADARTYPAPLMLDYLTVSIKISWAQDLNLLIAFLFFFFLFYFLFIYFILFLFIFFFRSIPNSFLALKYVSSLPSHNFWSFFYDAITI